MMLSAVQVGAHVQLVSTLAREKQSEDLGAAPKNARRA